MSSSLVLKGDGRRLDVPLGPDRRYHPHNSRWMASGREGAPTGLRRFEPAEPYTTPSRAGLGGAGLRPAPPTKPGLRGV